MEKLKNYHYVIIKTLLKKGSFSISEIENKMDFSRSTISKALRDLVDANILIMTLPSGAGVKYKLADSEKALNFIFSDNETLTIDDFAKVWDSSLSSAKKNIKKYIDSKKLSKQGTPPQRIIYKLVISKNNHKLSEEQINVINKYYAYISPDGQLLKGLSGFIYWAENKSGRKDFSVLAQEYLNTRLKYYNDKQHVFLIDASSKISETFADDAALTKLFHRDFDSLPVFGKTYLSQMIRIAKAGRTNTAVMTYIVDNIRASILYINKTYNIEAIGFIPPTVNRRVQLMSFISNKLRLDLPVISIKKNTSLEPVQQKSLKKINDRILNANKTIITRSEASFNNVLLIDDVTGSGATLNETAKKLLNDGVAKNVYGFTITGSAKANDFDVISEA